MALLVRNGFNQSYSLLNLALQLVRVDFGASCCGRSQATITVRVGNYRPDLQQNPVCNKFTGHIEEGRPLFLPCARPMPGAFVSIHLDSPQDSAGNPLSICEMFVYTDHGTYKKW